jgi:hypothetical protein
VEDFVYGDMYKKPDPLMLFCQNNSYQDLFIRFKSGSDAKASLAKIGDVMKDVTISAIPLNTNFSDAEF